MEGHQKSTLLVEGTYQIILEGKYMFNKKVLVPFISLVVLILAGCGGGNKRVSTFITDAAENKITVLTYNTHLMKGSFIQQGEELMKELGIEDNPDPIILDDDLRMERIVEMIGATNADIVALEEVWNVDYQESIIDALKDQYKFSYVGDIESRDLRSIVCLYEGSCKNYDRLRGYYDARNIANPILPLAGPFLVRLGEHAVLEIMGKRELAEKIMRIWDEKGRHPYRHKTNPGLVLLSRLPLEDRSFKRFSELNDDDKYSLKGVLAANVVLPNGQRIRVAISHAGTDMGGEGQPNIQEIAEEARKIEGPAILMGDFNVHTSKYKKMDNILKSVGAVDAFLEYRESRQQDMKDSETIDLSENKLHQYFSPEKNPADKTEGNFDRIDYVYVKKSARELELEIDDARVIKNWKYKRFWSGEKDLSDHFPVVVEFSWKCAKNVTACPDRITSSFDRDIDWWSGDNVKLGPNWHSTESVNGNIQAKQTGEKIGSGPWWFVTSPKFIGNKEEFYSGKLSYSLKWRAAEPSKCKFEEKSPAHKEKLKQFWKPDVMLESSGSQPLGYFFPAGDSAPDAYDKKLLNHNKWNKYEVPLVANDGCQFTDWDRPSKVGCWVKKCDNPPCREIASEQDLKNVLRNVTGIYIRGEYCFGNTNRGLLDYVSLCPPGKCLVPPTNLIIFR